MSRTFQESAIPCSDIPDIVTKYINTPFSFDISQATGKDVTEVLALVEPINRAHFSEEVEQAILIVAEMMKEKINTLKYPHWKKN